MKCHQLRVASSASPPNNQTTYQPNMKFLNLFKKRRRIPKEIAPQFTLHERRALETPFLQSGPVTGVDLQHMERDAMVQTALTLKRLGVLAAPWKIEPSDATPIARRNADFIEESFSRMEGSPDTILSQAMSAFSRGWSLQEMVYVPDGRAVRLHAVRPKDVSKFGMEIDAFGRVTGLKLQIAGEPERDLPRGKFILYANRAELGKPRGVGDLEAAHPHWRSKRALLEAWRLHLERFASPTLLGRYERGLPPEEQASMLASLNGVRNNTAIVFPNEIEVSTLGGSRESSSGFMEAIEFHNREIARAILGQTLTTDEGRRVGSLALGKVHLQVLLLQLAALRRDLADVVMTEQVIRPLIELNFGPGSVPRFVFDEPQLAAFSTGIID